MSSDWTTVYQTPTSPLRIPLTLLSFLGSLLVGFLGVGALANLVFGVMKETGLEAVRSALFAGAGGLAFAYWGFTGARDDVLDFFWSDTFEGVLESVTLTRVRGRRKAWVLTAEGQRWSLGAMADDPTGRQRFQSQVGVGTRVRIVSSRGRRNISLLAVAAPFQP